MDQGFVFVVGAVGQFIEREAVTLDKVIDDVGDIRREVFAWHAMTLFCIFRLAQRLSAALITPYYNSAALMKTAAFAPFSNGKGG
ncbi:MAG: hypothetical protein IE920_10560 [Thiotrichales bacterium]|nr:hypothetical protein [Thiotrichales bacterium]